MDGNKIKALLYSYLRFNRGFNYLATECGGFYADLLAVHKDLLYEFEIKTSYSDFLADFKKHKHESYADYKGELKKLTKLQEEKKYTVSQENIVDFTPNYFSFVVTEDIQSKVLEFLKENNMPYGLFVVESDNKHNVKSFSNRIRSIKRPKALHIDKVHYTVKVTILLRMSSMIGNYMQDNYKHLFD